VLDILNQILTAKDRTIEDIKNTFYIAKFIVENSDDYELTSGRFNSLKNLSIFFQNDKAASRDGFSQILLDIIEEIKKLPPAREAYDTYDESQVLKEFIKKLSTVFSVGNAMANYPDRDFYNFMTKILGIKTFYLGNINYTWENLSFMETLLKIPTMERYPDKRDIVIDTLLEKPTTFVLCGNGCDFEPYVIKVLCNEDLLTLDDEYYKKVVEIVLRNIQGFVLNIPIKNSAISIEKKKIIIDYYYQIFSRCMLEWNMIAMGKAKEVSLEQEYTIAYSKRLLAMSDEEYRKTLEGILECNKPVSYSIVVMNDELSEKRRAFACNLIIPGEVREHKGYSDDNHDYKHFVAEAAVSPMLNLMSDEEYEKILTLINTLCERAEDAYHSDSKGGFDEYRACHSRARAITELLFNTKMFSEDLPRLFLAINEISNMSDGKDVSEKVVNFCSDEYSMYYGDKEYKLVLETLRDPDNEHSIYDLRDLFTNKNIPFMSSEELLFLFTEAVSPYSDLKKLINKLNAKGVINFNAYQTFNNVDPELRDIVTGVNPNKGKIKIKI
jgi:hypothetical protein